MTTSCTADVCTASGSPADHTLFWLLGFMGVLGGIGLLLFLWCEVVDHSTPGKGRWGRGTMQKYRGCDELRWAYWWGGRTDWIRVPDQLPLLKELTGYMVGHLDPSVLTFIEEIWKINWVLRDLKDPYRISALKDKRSRLIDTINPRALKARERGTEDEAAGRARCSERISQIANKQADDLLK